MKKLIFIFGVGLSVSACGSTLSQTATTVVPKVSSPAASTVSPVSTTLPTTPPTTSSTAAPQVVTMKASGTGPASDITLLVGSQESQHNNVALPYATTEPMSQLDYGITVQDGSGLSSATISCEIDIPGSAPVMQTSTGAYAVVTCSATPGL